MGKILFCLQVFIGTMYANTAFAYIDPGSSLLVLQGIFALIGALVFFVRHPLQVLKALIKKFGKKDNA